MRSGLITTIALVGLLTWNTPVYALAIVGNFAPSSGPDGDPAHGGGTIHAIFEAAAGYWEAAILDDVTVTIDYMWNPGSQGLGASFGDSRTGSIFISEDLLWFVDPTPDINEEYASFARSTANVDGTLVNYAVQFFDGFGAAIGYDLLTVMLHEIGHVLSLGPSAFPDYADGDVDITAPRPLAGISIPVANGCCHIGLPPGYLGFNPLLFPFVDMGERQMISDAALLFVAETGEWEHLDPTRFAPVPEPAALVLTGVGLAGIAWRRRSTG